MVNGKIPVYFLKLKVNIPNAHRRRTLESTKTMADTRAILETAEHLALFETSGIEHEKSPLEHSAAAALTSFQLQELIDTNKALRETLSDISNTLSKGHIDQGSMQVNKKPVGDENNNATESRPMMKPEELHTRPERVPEMSLKEIKKERDKRREYLTKWRRGTGNQLSLMQIHIPQEWMKLFWNSFAPFPLQHWVTMDDLEFDAFNVLCAYGCSECHLYNPFSNKYMHEQSCIPRLWTVGKRFEFLLTKGLRYSSYADILTSYTSGLEILFEVVRFRRSPDGGKWLRHVPVSDNTRALPAWSQSPIPTKTFELLQRWCCAKRLMSQQHNNQSLVEKQYGFIAAALAAWDINKACATWCSIIRNPWTEIGDKVGILLHPLEHNRANFEEIDADVTLDPHEFHVRILTGLGGLKIRWTNSLEKHLTVTRDGIFLNIFRRLLWLDDDEFGQHGLRDLQMTYGLIFGTRSSPFHDVDRTLERLRREFSNPNIVFSDLCNNPEWPAAMALFHDVYAISGPRSWNHGVDPTVDPALTSVNEIDYEYAASPIFDVVKKDFPCPEELSLIMEGIAYYQPHRLGQIFEGPYGGRLWRLKRVMDKKKPKTIPQLWKDARDATTWYTFWAVLCFGIASIVLALGSLIVSIAQAVGTFKGLH